MALSITSIVNMALGRFGAQKLSTYEDDATPNGILARLFYEQTRDALLRSHEWRFALAREALSEEEDTPAFEWDHQYLLPADFLRLTGLYNTTASFAIEGDKILTNDDAVDLVYVRRVTDPTDFDPLFVEVLVLQLAIKFHLSLSEDRHLRQSMQEELVRLLARVRTVNKQETNNVGESDMGLWNNARLGGTSIGSRMGQP